jgi:hypothetical protein
MFMRRRPLLRAAVIGGGAYAAGKRSAQRLAEQARQEQGDQRDQRDQRDHGAGPAEDEQNERIASPEQRQQVQQATGQPAAADGPGRSGGAVPKPSMLDQLNQLNRMHQQGALTDQEFSAAKAKLLSS